MNTDDDEIEQTPVQAIAANEEQEDMIPTFFDPATWEKPDDELSDEEQDIAEIWKTVLAVDHVSRNDDFFKLGGNSLLAVSLIARVNESFGANLPIQSIFDGRGIASLAQRLRQGQESIPNAVPLERVDLTNGVGPTFPQIAMLMDATKISFNLCSAMWIEGAFDADAMRRCLTSLLERHDALRSRFQMSGTALKMVIGADAPDILRVVELPDEDPEATQRQVMEQLEAERCKPFDLNNGLPIRALLIRLSPLRHVFMVSVHHVASDEWSANVLKHDISRLYAAELDASLVKPDALPIRYGDYAVWQAKLHLTADYGRQFAHWQGELESLRAGAVFPPAVATAADTGYVTKYMKLELPSALEQTMAALSARYGYTNYVVMMAALQLALAEYSGFEQQIVWAPVTRRTRSELEGMMGMFTNLSLIITECRPDLSLTDFLAEVDRKVSLARNNSDVSTLTVAIRNPQLIPNRPMIGLNFIDLHNSSAWVFPDATVVPIPLQLQQEADVCALELSVRVVRGAMSMTMVYNTSQFDANGVTKIVAKFWSMIENFGSCPERTIGEALAKQA